MDIKTAPTPSRATMKMDLAERSLDIHWPANFSPTAADLFAHNELLIEAPCETVWKQIVDAGNWPQWYPNSKDVVMLDGAKELGPDTRWRWTTFGLAIESRVHEYQPYSRLGWYGYAPGAAPAFSHTWFLRPHSGGCLVLTEEVGIGKDAAHLRETNEGLMHRGHDLWLAGLKWVSEQFIPQ
ncbi:MAG TPA: SRPBCC family protein [Xanthobacteraceae bacterium]